MPNKYRALKVDFDGVFYYEIQVLVKDDWAPVKRYGIVLRFTRLDMAMNQLELLAK